MLCNRLPGVGWWCASAFYVIFFFRLAERFQRACVVYIITFRIFTVKCCVWVHLHKNSHFAVIMLANTFSGSGFVQLLSASRSFGRNEFFVLVGELHNWRSMGESRCLARKIAFRERLFEDAQFFWNWKNVVTGHMRQLFEKLCRWMGVGMGPDGASSLRNSRQCN